jgi:hypothetical protein
MASLREGLDEMLWPGVPPTWSIDAMSRCPAAAAHGSRLSAAVGCQPSQRAIDDGDPRRPAIIDVVTFR